MSETSCVTSARLASPWGLFPHHRHQPQQSPASCFIQSTLHLLGTLRVCAVHQSHRQATRTSSRLLHVGFHTLACAIQINRQLKLCPLSRSSCWTFSNVASSRAKMTASSTYRTIIQSWRMKRHGSSSDELKWSVSTRVEAIFRYHKLAARRSP